jgi:hypothetical protein
MDIAIHLHRKCVHYILPKALQGGLENVPGTRSSNEDSYSEPGPLGIFLSDHPVDQNKLRGIIGSYPFIFVSKLVFSGFGLAILRLKT